jgi:integrase
MTTTKRKLSLSLDDDLITELQMNSDASPQMKVRSGEELRAFATSVAEHRWAGIWALIATTGMRRGEVLGRRWSDVDLDSNPVWNDHHNVDSQDGSW